MNNFYIYIYLDPRKKENYSYGSYKFEYEPFYVGKGKDERWKDTNRRNKYFKHKINKIKENGLEPIVVKIKEDLTEENSFILESKLISLIGREDLNKGTLINFTNGGEGSIGHVVSEESRKLMSEKKKGENNSFYNKKHSEKTLKLLSEKRKGENHPRGMLNKHHSEKTKELISENHVDNKGENNPMYGKYHSEESLKLMSENNSRSTLKEQDIIQIRLLCDEGILTQAEIGEKFGVSRGAISKIKNRKTWKHIK